MAKPYTVNITNGQGSAEVLNDTYTVTANVTGYDNATIDPSSLQVVDGTNNYAFTISATGTLTLHVTEDGTSTGTPIVGATFIRTDSTGTEYGNLITTDATGNAVFNNVPFAQTGAPIIYFKQIASDGEHEFDTLVQNTTMTESTFTLEIINAAPALRTFTLQDANYENLNIDTGSITLS